MLFLFASDARYTFPAVRMRIEPVSPDYSRSRGSSYALSYINPKRKRGHVGCAALAGASGWYGTVNNPGRGEDPPGRDGNQPWIEARIATRA